MATIPHHRQQQQQHFLSKSSFRNLFAVDNQMPNSTSFVDQSLPQYIPPYSSGEGGGVDRRWINGFQPKKMRLIKEEELDTNNNNFLTGLLPMRSVPTGLGLSLDDKSSVEFQSSLLLDDSINKELQRQDAEIDHLIKVQGEQLRQTIQKKVRANQLQTFSFVKERILQNLREKEMEVEDVNKKNTELEEQIRVLLVDAGNWKHQAKSNENMITTLRINLQKVSVQNKNSKEGCGDSELDDTVSFCNGGTINQLVCKEHKGLEKLMTCKVCGYNEACMLLLPCRHLCLCKNCESKILVVTWMYTRNQWSCTKTRNLQPS
ncbi:BOI-related E3 ubiquitin-protein ligase 1-like isoform X2 [Papaver somniferum]|uniref:BOI-related E3 ubiquitin-protein ligase 1-like isoform X2 n=1 Tax=Papaver somniferum TaxID=3469 RepID=UPI000E6F6559|nr:BOI-related E3 ubiquitin-protein ligase 1-like isoform X2 [Papaver somniferum]XP_026402295.1 BOI-related E3 ubiquitin-protein ligase 1-like isoform X2 [Papaver somniferum]XP_026402304.1 BOI-related E3 ubiquitin-protein ligase 1-like isoform X2 [Papaver somniferum]XP_026402312.1 BOI-related E3 ubiquitin-protein ligase 1-like isoform X2 [Papaver somniferum]